MNANRRKALADVADMLEEAKSKLEDILGEEEEYRDNMPENMQYAVLQLQESPPGQDPGGLFL